MKILIFLGSVRDSGPPRPARLGLRVSHALLNFFEQAFSDHSIEIIDPLDYVLGPVFKPHFSYAPSRVPQDLESLAQKIEQADGYVMVSPEYNHSMSPALSNLLNHFGSSIFSYKPSTIVTYSAGQWGGSRAAVGMRTFLSELGCLPVSAMIHISHAQQVFDEAGAVLKGVDENKWHDYFARALKQMLWWAQGAKEQSERIDPHDLVKAFKRDPSQRNAP